MAKKNDRVVYAKLTKPTNIVQEIKGSKGWISFICYGEPHHMAYNMLVQ